MSDAPRILAIAGSPRRDGNSDRLLDRCLRGVAVEGGAVHRIVAAKSGVEACRGCNACSLSRECIVHDGMQAIYEQLDAADAVVISTAVYFGTVPAVLKAIYDRLQPYWARLHVLKEPELPVRPGALLLVGGGGDPYGTECAVKVTRSAFASVNVHFDDVLEVVGVDSPSDIGRHPDVLDRAERLGRELVLKARK